MKVLNNKCTGKIRQKCEITIKINDLDHAYAIARTIDAALSECGKGGDFHFVGKFIGHDVNSCEVTLRIAESDSEKCKNDK